MKTKIWHNVLVLTAVVALGTTSCSKDRDENPDTTEITTPYSSVPLEVSNKIWFSGTLSAISYYDQHGHNLGNDYEAGREFQFYQDDKGRGRVKFWQYLGMRTYSTCVTEYYTYKEGTVVFSGDKFTFYPIKGKFKTIKDKCSTSNGTTTREADADDLKPDTYRWEIKDINGKAYLYTYADDDVNHSDVLFVYEAAQ